MSNSIHHVNIMVDDLAAATQFYEEVLGLEKAFTPDLGFPAQFFSVGGGQEIHVNELEDIHPERAHFCVRLDDFNGVFDRALERGVIDTDVWGKVRRLPTGVMQGFIRDPSGNLIEISCYADVPVDPAIIESDLFESSDT